MVTAQLAPRLDQLRQTLAALDPSLVGFAGESNALALGVSAIIRPWAAASPAARCMSSPPPRRFIWRPPAGPWRR